MSALDDLAGRLTCTVEEAAHALGIGRNQAYAAVRANELPHLRLGSRILIKVPALLELCGTTPEASEVVPATGTTAAYDHSNTSGGALDASHAATNIHPIRR